MARGWGGAGGVKCERVESMFNQELTPIGPHPNFILFNPLHCYKNSFTLLEITIGQDKIYGWSAHYPLRLLIRKHFLHSVHHRVHRVLGFFSSRPNWDPPTPSPTGVVSPPLFWFRGGWDKLACREGVGVVPIQTRGQMLWHTRYIFTFLPT